MSFMSGSQRGSPKPKLTRYITISEQILTNELISS